MSEWEKSMLPIVDLETGEIVEESPIAAAEVIPTGEVHPVANLFPMLPDDELQELADDIRANGLQHPIVLDKDGVLIDGRNRWAACQMAGVDPAFTTINGQDPIAYILSSNIARRHMTKGQRAMAVAMACPETGQSVRHVAEIGGVSKSRVDQANAVRQFAPDLVPGVLAGSPALDEAYAEARKRKQSAESDEARLKQLHEEDPKLATLVVEGDLSLSEAWETYQRRIREALERRKEVTRGYLDGIGKLWAYLAADEDIIVRNWEPSANSVKHAAPLQHLATATGVRMVAHRLERLAQEIDKQGGELA